jgi:hypothetical protein
MNSVFFFSGIAAAGFGFSSLFFLKFYLASRDKFFLYLCMGFVLMATERCAALLTHMLLPTDPASRFNIRGWIYLIRLMAYVTILIGVYYKNKTSTRSK